MNFSHPILAPALVTVALATVAVAASHDPQESPGAAWSASRAHGDLPAADIVASSATYDELVQQYCVRCHSDARMRGNLSLEGFSFDNAPEEGEVTERMINKLLVGMMPPAGSRQPTGDSLKAFQAALEQRMDEAASKNLEPGSRTFQRMNRAEYTAAVRDLLGIQVDVGAYLPLDTKSANFDNIADVQLPSATLMEGYLRAAGQISREALGDPKAAPGSTPYAPSRTASQKERVPGAPFGTRGGIAVGHNFPADGHYVFQVMLHAAPEGELFGRRQLNERIEVSVDGERVAVLDIDRWMSDSDPQGMMITTDSVFVRAGARRVAATFVQQFEGPVADLMRDVDHTLADTQIGLDYGVTTLPHLQKFTVVGPYNVTGVSETESRRRIFTCRPLTPEEAAPCAESILRRVATRAYRRPLNDNDMAGLMSFYELGAEEGFEAGIRLGIEAVLASPHFVFRTEEVPNRAEPGSIYRISDVDLASRLSFFLWGSIPDQELLDLAAKDDLTDGDNLERQVARMLADDRSKALASRFAAQWLRLPDLEKVHPDALDYPYFDETLANSMQRETELLFEHLVEEDKSVLDLVTADYTFVNERLARHYGIQNVTGNDFQMVQYPSDQRRGLLGHGSVLTLTSHANRTSPVLRGKWVMEVLLGSPPPPPPPNVPGLEEVEAADEGRSLTVRERMEIHRANPTCNACHRVIDPLGLALENFDVTGAFRTKDEGNRVDPAGELFDGTPVNGPTDLHDLLISRPEVFLRTFTENLMAYGLGRRVEYYDMPTVRAITREAAKDGYRISSFVQGVVASPAFQTNRMTVVADEFQESTGAS